MTELALLGGEPLLFGGDIATYAGYVDPTAGTLDQAITIEETSAAAKTSELFRFGLPLADGALLSGENVRLYDITSGEPGTELTNYQTDNAATNAAGNIKFVACAGIFPSLASGGVRKIKAIASTGVQPSGTAITASDLLATSLEVEFDVVIGGATYTAVLSNALAAGATFSKAAASTLGTWRSGPCMVEIICRSPFFNGGTAHNSGDGLQCEFHVRAWKAGTAAVDGGNPILGVDVLMKVENGAADRASRTPFTITSYEIRRSTSLSVATQITTNQTDADGNTLHMTGATSFAIADGHAFTRRAFIGDKPTNVFAYGNVSSADDCPDESHLNYLISTHLIPNLVLSRASISHASAISDIASDYDDQTPFQSGSTRYAEIQKDIGGTGSRKDIGVIPGWTAQGLTRWDADGRRRIFVNAEAFLAIIYGAMRYYDDATYKGQIHPVAKTSYQSYSENTTSRVFIWDPSHEPNVGAVEYMLTGDYIYCEQILSRTGWWHNYHMNSFFANGSGTNATALGNAANGTLPWDIGFSKFEEQRAIGWVGRDYFYDTLLCPDGSSDNLRPAKSDMTAFADAHAARGAAVISANTGTSGEAFYTGHYLRWLKLQDFTNFDPDAALFAPWQYAYVCAAINQAYDMGQLSGADADTFHTWLNDWWKIWINDSDVFTDRILSAYWIAIDTTTTPGSYTGTGKSEVDMYIQMCEHPFGEGGYGLMWNGNSTASVTLSATSGTGVTVTLPTNFLDGLDGTWWTTTLGTSFFGQTGNSAYGVITGIDTVNDTLTIDVVNTFSSTTLTNGQWAMTPPKPADLPAKGNMTLGFGVADAEQNRVIYARAACAIGYGNTDAAACYDGLTTWLSGQSKSEASYDTQWTIRKRT